MNKVLSKRLLRELRSNLGRYLALVLLIIMGMYIITSVVSSAETIITRTAEHSKANKLETVSSVFLSPLQMNRKRRSQTRG